MRSRLVKHSTCFFVRQCEYEFYVNGKSMKNCTKERMRPEDLTDPCRLFIKELEFRKKLDIKRNIPANKSKYNLMSLDELTIKSDSPVALSVAVSKYFHSITHIIFLWLIRLQRKQQTFTVECPLFTNHKSNLMKAMDGAPQRKICMVITTN